MIRPARGPFHFGVVRHNFRLPLQISPARYTSYVDECTPDEARDLRNNIRRYLATDMGASFTMRQCWIWNFEAYTAYLEKTTYIKKRRSDVR